MGAAAGWPVAAAVEDRTRSGGRRGPACSSPPYSPAAARRRSPLRRRVARSPSDVPPRAGRRRAPPTTPLRRCLRPSGAHRRRARSDRRAPRPFRGRSYSLIAWATSSRRRSSGHVWSSSSPTHAASHSTKSIGASAGSRYAQKLSIVDGTGASTASRPSHRRCANASSWNIAGSACPIGVRTPSPSSCPLALVTTPPAPGARS